MSDTAPPRHLTLLPLLFLMLNGIVGAGIFGLPQDVQRLAGAWGVWLFPLCAVLIFPVILVFVQLGGRHSGTGGPMLYVSAAFGPFAGFQTGWAFYVARLTAFAANINLLLTTLAAIWPELSQPVARTVLLTVVIGLLVGFNVHGPRTAVGSLGVLTLAKFLPLLAVAGVGLLVMPAAPLPAPGSGTGSLDPGSAILLVVYAYVGFESGLVPAAEARSPRRDIPRALILSLLLAALLYSALYVVCSRLLPELAHTAQPIVAAGQRLFGPAGAMLITAGVAASVLGNLMGAAFSTPRVTWQLAQSGYLPAGLAALHPRSGMPAASIVLFGGLALLLAASGTFVWLASISVVVRVLIYLACVAALHARVPAAGAAGAPAGNRSGGRVIAAFAVLFCFYLLWQAPMQSWLASAALLFAGWLLFLATRLKT